MRISDWSSDVCSSDLVRIGDRLGLYKALHADGSMTPAELATKNECRGALCARMAVASGCVRLSDLRLQDGQVHLAARTGDGVRRARQPRLPARRFRPRGDDDGKSSARSEERGVGKEGASKCR